jgi:hypothetical protein
MFKYIIDRGFGFATLVIGVAAFSVLLDRSGGFAEVGKTLFSGLGSTVATLTDRPYRGV